MAKADDYVVGIDIGSSKVLVLIARRDGRGGLEIAGRGQAPNRGTRRGSIVNLEATLEALKAATEEAEVMAGTEIGRAYVGVAGADVRCVNVRGKIDIARKDREITKADIQRVLEVAQAAPIPSEREILHAVAQEFIVDEQGGIADPVGMMGSKLEVLVHLVSTQRARSKTILTCVNRTGIEVEELVFEPLATAEVVLTPDERDLGALLVDVGAGTTAYALFAEGVVQHSGVLPIGGGHFTNDLAVVLRTPHPEAERLKITAGCCLESMLGEEQEVAVPGVAASGIRYVPKREICEILQPRAEELLQLLREELKAQGWEGHLRGGVVLTGGGAQLEGLPELAGQLLGTTVRVGTPTGLGGLMDGLSEPSASTAAGLLRYGLQAEMLQPRRARRGFSFAGVVGTLRNVFSDLL
jgi:cell division protein FtsA